MKRTLFYYVIGLALVLCLILPMAVPVMASEISGTKERDPDEEPYEVGETIHFVMTVTNPSGNTETNTLTRIWDTLPDGTVVEFLGASETLVQTPGESANFNASYLVSAADLEWIVPADPSIDPYWGVRNKFEAEGYDSAVDDVYVFVESNTRVTQLPPPPVGGQAFPVSKLSILVPWIALGAAIIAGAGIFVRRRHVRS